ncbi:2-hydroxycarboxylate transporter family protein [Phenylobacterium sp.]|uniref:2-hydroxycarboxylate transporter family protein n=1 Tax=Phenylobacterium sp. TaxID=1871053 RepID=UPI00286B144F|nr:2-hydroxycarboxylate transporter family protein [Phenylobacterium sp.]
MSQAPPADAPPLAQAAPDAPPAGLRLWWSLMDFRIGIVPLPVLVVIAGVAAVFVRAGEVPADILMSIAVLAAGGFLCAEVGRRTPLLRHLGLAAILATFAPSFLVYVHALPKPLVKSITTFTDSSNFLYLFIAAIIVGSILGMDRRMLIAGFAKIFIPLILGSVAAFGVGCSVGVALGLGFKHTLFKIVVPIMAGGVGEGAVPLSVGYAQFSHQPQGGLFAEVLPIVMLGSLTAIVLAGALNFVGKRFPSLTGEGRLQPGEQDVPLEAEAQAEAHANSDPQTIGAALLMIVTLYLLGAVAQKLWQWPGPVVMLGLAVAMKLARVASPALERGAYATYRFFSACVTYPLLFAIGVAKTPWAKLISAFNLPTLVTIVATVVTLMGTGFLVARFVRIYPIEAAIVNATHSGQGGTGDVAILTAANRMQLMPFAQIATRIGGAITVTIALIAYAHFGG